MSFSQQEVWESRAVVRTKSRPVFKENQNGYFYPISRQPLALHPLVENLGSEALHYLLAQSLYKYANDIAIVELRVVNQGILAALSNELVYQFTPEQKVSLYTIMVDEAYHAYVSFDAMIQIQSHTGIKPLALPQMIEIELAIRAIKEKLPVQYHREFEFVAVCLAENTLTKEIVSMLDEEETQPFFQQLIQEHLADESRHAGIFFHLLKTFWEHLPYEYQFRIRSILPEFLKLYLGNVIQTEFDKRILMQLGLTTFEANEVIEDTYGHFRVTPNHPMLKNVLSILSKAGVMHEAILD